MESDSSDNGAEEIVVMDMVNQDSEEDLSGTSESEMEADPNEDSEPVDQTPYDPEVTPYHLYLGSMECVPGMRYFDPKSVIRIYHTFHNSIVYPGEVIPMIFSSDAAAAQEFGTKPIGLVFAERTTLRGYGVTCQVVEKRLSHDHKIRAKIRVLQRFKVLSQLPLYPYSIVLLPHYSTDSQMYYIHVEILPEFELGPPIAPQETNSVNRWATNKSLVNRMRLFKAMSQPWPRFVYNLYDVQRIMMKMQYFSVEVGIDNMPENPQQCSFWSARNLPLTDEDQAAIFKSNFVESRMLLIEKNLNLPYKYCCLTCGFQIANFRDVFPMTKDGVQASYCNKNGFIHETVTVSCVDEDSLAIEERASTKFSWFPGYSWRIAYCQHCSRHKGWKFTAVRKDLKPDFFFGLSRTGVVLRKVDREPEIMSFS